jgi:hypothetical protein
VTGGVLLVAIGGVLLYLTVEEYLPINYGVYPALLILIGLVVLAETLLVNIFALVVSRLIRRWWWCFPRLRLSLKASSARAGKAWQGEERCTIHDGNRPWAVGCFLGG